MDLPGHQAGARLSRAALIPEKRPTAGGGRMKAVHPYLLFRGNTAEAFEFYEQVFDSKVMGTMHFRDFGEDGGMGLAEDELDLIANTALPLTDGVLVMGHDARASMDTGLPVRS